MAYILLIEPDKLQATSISSYLDMSGHNFVWVTNGQDAIALADERRPDFVIIELGLVGHSGLEFLYEFRSYDDWLDVPIIALTSLNTSDRILMGPTWQSLNIAKVLNKSSTTLARLQSEIIKLQQTKANAQ
jgi:DNA-binding response OmpR family regulator